MGEIINSPVSSTVYLGFNGYPTQLTVTDSGSIQPPSGADGIFGEGAAVSVLNQGVIHGGSNGQFGGGMGILLESSATVTNSGVIAGGLGGVNPSGAAYAGGIGINLTAGGAITNGGDILGGNGAYETSDAGGIGVDIVTGGASITNNGFIAGGYGGSIGGGSADGGGSGGTGVLLGTGTLTNNGYIFGGNAGAGYADAGSGTAGQAGTGVTMVQLGTVTNAGRIYGGSGYNNTQFSGGEGGIGVQVSMDGLLNNSGFIQGGAGGYGAEFGTGGFGGYGVVIGDNGRVNNTGHIYGGAGGIGYFGTYRGGSGGAGVEITAFAALNNFGLISGGAGGTGYPSGSYGGFGASGVYIDGGTLNNDGTVEGGLAGPGNGSGRQDAVFFQGNGTLAVDPAAIFLGQVVAHATYNDVLRLQGTTATGTITGIGTHFTGFDTILDAAKASWNTAGINTAGAAALEIFGALRTGGAFSDTATTTLYTGGLLLAETGLATLAHLDLNGGDLNATATGSLSIGAGTAGAAAGVITIESGATISGFGTLGSGTARIADNGTITDTGGKLTLNGRVSGAGAIAIDAHNTLVDAAGISTALTFAGPGARLNIAKTFAATGKIAGFATGNIIDYLATTATSLKYSGGILTLKNGTATVEKLTFTGTYTLADFALKSDGAGGTEIIFAGPAAPNDALGLHAPLDPFLPASLETLGAEPFDMNRLATDWLFLHP